MMLSLYLSSDSVHPVCLPPYQLPIKVGAELVVTGWGLLDEQGECFLSFFNKINY